MHGWSGACPTRAPPLDPGEPSSTRSAARASTDSCAPCVLTGVEQQRWSRGVGVRAVVGAVAWSAADEGIDGEVLGPRRHRAGSGGFHVRRHHRVRRPADSSYPCADAAGLGRGPLVAPQAALGNASGRRPRGAGRPAPRTARPSPPPGAGGRPRTPIGRTVGEGGLAPGPGDRGRRHPRRARSIDRRRRQRCPAAILRRASAWTTCTRAAPADASVVASGAACAFRRCTSSLPGHAPRTAEIRLLNCTPMYAVTSLFLTPSPPLYTHST